MNNNGRMAVVLPNGVLLEKVERRFIIIRSRFVRVYY